MPKPKTDNTTTERSARYRLRRKADLERLTGLYNGISELIKVGADDAALANFCKSYLNLKKES